MDRTSPSTYFQANRPRLAPLASVRGSDEKVGNYVKSCEAEEEVGHADDVD
jgi:hypothetical protein